MPWAYELCRNISIELNNGDFLGVSVARNKFEEFILRLLREIVNDKEDNKIITTKVYGDVSIRNEKIDHFFNVNYNVPNITIYDLAGDLNLSVRQVNRILKEEYNTSFHKKLIGIRLMHGKKNLLRTERTMEEIAEKIGFSSPSGFYVAFKKEFGITPSEFKKQNKFKIKN